MKCIQHFLLLYTLHYVSDSLNAPNHIYFHKTTIQQLKYETNQFYAEVVARGNKSK
jgi:hypothetical protein